MFVSGIASGIDTEALIAQLMAIERRPAVLWQRQQNTIQSQLNAVRDVNTRLANFESRLGDLMSPAAFQQWKATSSEASIIAAEAGASAAAGTYALSVQQLALAHRIGSEAQGDAESPLNLSGTVQINGVDVEIGAQMSLADVAAAINEAEAGVTATLIDATLVLESNETGEANRIQLVDSGGPVGVLQSLGLLDGDGEIQHELQAAQDAKVSINGVVVARSSNRVSDAVQGVSFTLRDVGDASVTVERDTAGAIQRVRAFVDQYNSLQDYIASITSKDALLQGDGMLVRLQSALHLHATGFVDAPDDFQYKALSHIGISVDRFGKMTLDENQLKTALEENPDQARAVFTATAASDGFDGVAARLRSYVREYTQTGTGMMDNRKAMYEKRMESLKLTMERFEARLALREERLTRQFIELEKALASMQSLGAALAGQISQMQLMNMQRASR